MLPTAPKPFPAPASGPILEAGLVGTVPTGSVLKPVSQAGLGLGGVAVVNGTPVTIDGTRIVRTDNVTGITSVVAGILNSGSCKDTASGATARFQKIYGGVRMAGTDGRFVYVTDACGLRRVEPVSGATTTLTTAFYRYTSIAGQILYGLDDAGVLWRHDLATVAPVTMLTTLPTPVGAMAADDTDVWLQNGYGGILYDFDLATGTLSTVSDTVAPTQQATAMVSVGGVLYANMRSKTSPYEYSTLIRIDKGTGAWSRVAGSDTGGHTDGGYGNARFGSITGIAVDGDSLLLSDSSTSASYLRRAVLPASVFDDVLFVPTTNTAPAGWVDPILVWNPSTGLCVSECSDAYQWRQMMYEQAGPYSFWHVVQCRVADQPCTPEEFEKDLIKKVVDMQGVYNPNGTLRADFITDAFLTACYEKANNPSTDCSKPAIDQASRNVTTFDELMQAMAVLVLNSPGGARPALTPEQQAAKARVDQIGKQACSEVSGTRRQAKPSRRGEPGYTPASTNSSTPKPTRNFSRKPHI